MRREWKILLAVYFAGVAVIINQFKIPPALDILLSDLHLSMIQGSWLMSVFGISGVLLSFPAAMILDRLGPKISGSAALGCTVVGSVIGGASVNVTMMLTGRIIEGLGSGLIAVVAPSVIAYWFPPAKRGLPMGIWTSWRPMGTSLIFNMANPLIPAFGWRGIWWFGTLTAFLALVFFAAVVSKPPADAQRDRERTPGKLGLNLLVLKQPGIWLLGIVIGGLGFAKAGFMTWAPSYFMQVHGISLEWSNFLTSLTSILTIFSTIITGWVIDRFKRPLSTMIISSILSVILFGWAFLLTSESLILPWMMMLGFFPGFLAATVIYLAPAAVGAPKFAGYGMAMVSFMTNLGAVFGPPAVGGLISATGGNWSAGTIPLGGSVLVTFAATVVFALVSRTHQVQRNEKMQAL